MAVTEPIKGRYVDLRSCTEDDAEFTRDIRKDPEFVKFLPAIDNTVEQQKAWIKKQREKEGDYFFVVWDKDGNRIGTISIYNVHGDHAESGRLAIKGDNAFQGIEAQILSFRFAFGTLGLECIDGFIFADNERAIRFNKQFGGRHYPPETDEDGRVIIKIENWREDFERVNEKLSSILYREKKENNTMSNLEKYNKAFIETFEITGDKLEGLTYQDIEAWDSVGHMSLIAALEDAFDIMMDTDDIIDFNSYEKGKEILSKEEYGVEF